MGHPTAEIAKIEASDEVTTGILFIKYIELYLLLVGLAVVVANGKD